MKEKKTLKLLSFSAFLVLIVLTVIGYTSYANINAVKNQFETQVADAREEMWSFVVNTMTENQQKATLQADNVKDNIQRDITTAYGSDLTGLKQDMNSIEVGSTSTFLKTTSNAIKGKYINANNDSNDMFVIGKWIKSNSSEVLPGAIIADPSLDCSKKGEIRTFDVELSMHFNKELASSALTRVINQNTYGDPIIWEFKTSSNPDHKILTNQGLTGLKEVFMSEGISGLETYEVLNPSYLSSDKDIFSTNDVNYTGNTVDNYKIIVVQGFSLYDAIMTNHPQSVSDYEYKLKTLETTYNHQTQVLEIEMILSCALIFVVFFAIAKLQNVLIEQQA